MTNQKGLKHGATASSHLITAQWLTSRSPLSTSFCIFMRQKRPPTLITTRSKHCCYRRIPNLDLCVTFPFKPPWLNLNFGTGKHDKSQIYHYAPIRGDSTPPPPTSPTRTPPFHTGILMQALARMKCKSKTIQLPLMRRPFAWFWNIPSATYV